MAPECSELKEAVQTRKNVTRLMPDAHEDDKSDAEYGDGEEPVLGIHSFKPIYLISNWVEISHFEKDCQLQFYYLLVSDIILR